MPDRYLVQNGGRYLNVQKPPLATMTAAKGNGSCAGGGDTQAFRDAFDYLRDRFIAASGLGTRDASTLVAPNDIYDQTNDWIYVPDGTYCVGDTLIYDGQSLQDIYRQAYPSQPLGAWFDLTRIRIVGQSREGTVIQLSDNASGFGDATNPKPVLTVQHPSTLFNNWNGWNVIKNLTIDVGHGNPGAAALLVQGANTLGVQNLLLRTADVGAVGLWMPIGSVQGSMHDITIQGFNDGVRVSGNAETNPLLEYLTLQAQTHAGVAIDHGYVSMRKLAIDESTFNVPALVVTDHAAQTVLTDSVIAGGDAGSGAAITEGIDAGTILFLRNVTTSGYPLALQTPGSSISNSTIDEYVSSVPVSLFDAGGDAPHSLGLAVEEVPSAGWLNPSSDWANVEDFRAGDAGDDPAAQAALRSGKPVVVFPAASYAFSSSLEVPSTVQRIDFMYADIVHAKPLTLDGSDRPLIIENLRSSVFSIAVNNAQAVRNVALKNAALGFSNTVNASVKLWLETSNATPGSTFSAPQQQTWMHSNDTEYQPVQSIVNGGSLWLMGYKTEGGNFNAGGSPLAGTVVAVTQGAHVEVLGGYTNLFGPPPAGRPMLAAVDSSVSFVGSFSASGTDVYSPVISETQGGVTKTAPYDAFITFNDGAGHFRPFPGCFLVPLFVTR